MACAGRIYHGNRARLHIMQRHPMPCDAMQSTSKTAAGSAAAFYAHLSRDALMQQALADSSAADSSAAAGAGSEGQAAATGAAGAVAVQAASTASEHATTQRGLAECPGAKAINTFLMAGRRQLVEGDAGTGSVTVVVAADHAGRRHLGGV